MAKAMTYQPCPDTVTKNKRMSFDCAALHS